MMTDFQKDLYLWYSKKSDEILRHYKPQEMKNEKQIEEMHAEQRLKDLQLKEILSANEKLVQARVSQNCVV